MQGQFRLREFHKKLARYIGQLLPMRFTARLRHDAVSVNLQCSTVRPGQGPGATWFVCQRHGIRYLVQRYRRLQQTSQGVEIDTGKPPHSDRAMGARLDMDCHSERSLPQ